MDTEKAEKPAQQGPKIIFAEAQDAVDTTLLQSRRAMKGPGNIPPELVDEPGPCLECGVGTGNIYPGKIIRNTKDRKCQSCGRPVGPIEITTRDRHEIAAGKKMCGMCAWKAVEKGDWCCTHVCQVRGIKGVHACPAFNGECPDFELKPRVIKPIQPKPERLAVPPGMIFFYMGRVTVAVLLREEDVAVGIINMGFAFCHSGNAKKGIKPDRYSKTIGRNEAMKSLYNDPLIVPYLYDPIRIAKEVTRAVLGHDFVRLGRFGVLLPHNLSKRVPGWTNVIAKRLMASHRVSGLTRMKTGILPMGIMARMMTDIINLDRP